MFPLFAYPTLPLTERPLERPHGVALLRRCRQVFRADVGNHTRPVEKGYFRLGGLFKADSRANKIGLSLLQLAQTAFGFALQTLTHASPRFCTLVKNS